MEQSRLKRLLRTQHLKKELAELRLGDLRTQARLLADDLHTAEHVLSSNLASLKMINQYVGKRLRAKSVQLEKVNRQTLFAEEKARHEEQRLSKVQDWSQEATVFEEERLMQDAIEDSLSSQIHARENR
jgi:hypothetical protein